MPHERRRVSPKDAKDRKDAKLKSQSNHQNVCPIVKCLCQLATFGGLCQTRNPTSKRTGPTGVLSLKKIACVREHCAADRSPQRKSQLIVYDQHCISTQRTGHQLLISVRVQNRIPVGVALGDQDLGSCFFEPESSKIASASSKEPLGNRKRVLPAERRRQPKFCREREHSVAETTYRIKPIVLEIELHELLIAAARGRSAEKAPEGLISSCRIELVIALVSKEARSDSAKPDWLRVALNFFERQTLTISAGSRAREIEYAYAFEVVAEVHDEIQGVSLLNLKIHGVTIAPKTNFTESPREQRDQQRKVHSKRPRVLKRYLAEQLVLRDTHLGASCIQLAEQVVMRELREPPQPAKET